MVSLGWVVGGYRQLASGSESFTGWGALLADMRATRVMVLVVEEVLKVGKMAGVNGDLGGEDLGCGRDQP